VPGILCPEFCARKMCPETVPVFYVTSDQRSEDYNIIIIFIIFFCFYWYHNRYVPNRLFAGFAHCPFPGQFPITFRAQNFSSRAEPTSQTV
jgi:hypothetical protein